MAVPDAELYPAGTGPEDEGRFVVLRPPEPRHPRDFGPATLAPLVGRHPDPASLVDLRLHAWRTLGFYPDHAPRLWEYPVVAALVRGRLAADSHIIDIGAGVTPLPSYLTEAGYQVDTVDSSDIVRSWPPTREWNEWDFLDYAAAGLAHRSWNTTLSDLPLTPSFDGAYSVSVVEHLPADARRSLLTDIASRVRKDGLVVLTIDLVRGTDTLWNRSRGLEVEDPSIHGVFGDVVRECADVGLELVDEDRVRDWGDVDVDIGLLVLGQRRSPVLSPWQQVRRRLVHRNR